MVDTDTKNTTQGAESTAGVTSRSHSSSTNASEGSGNFISKLPAGYEFDAETYALFTIGCQGHYSEETLKKRHYPEYKQKDLTLRNFLLMAACKDQSDRWNSQGDSANFDADLAGTTFSRAKVEYWAACAVGLPDVKDIDQEYQEHVSNVQRDFPRYFYPWWHPSCVAEKTDEVVASALEYSMG